MHYAQHYSTTQKLAYSAGAFALVFSAAMAGSLFMITGGFTDGGRSPPADPPALISEAQAEPLVSESASSPPMSYTQVPVSYAQAPPAADVTQTMQVEPTPLPLAPPAHAAAIAPRLQPGSIEIIGSTPPPMTLREQTPEQNDRAQQSEKSGPDDSTDRPQADATSDDSSPASKDHDQEDSGK